MNRDFSHLIKQILQTDDLPIQLLEDLLAESGCRVRIELHVTRDGNTIVIREKLSELMEPEEEGMLD